MLVNCPAVGWVVFEKSVLKSAVIFSMPAAAGKTSAFASNHCRQTRVSVRTTAEDGHGNSASNANMRIAVASEQRHSRLTPADRFTEVGLDEFSFVMIVTSPSKS